MKRKLTIGTRGSDLALWQANWLKVRLGELYPELQVEIKVIKTQGDTILEAALYNLKDKGFFSKAIEDDLLAGKIDIAVHSLKDLPTKLPEGLIICAVSDREDAHDVFISKTHNSIQSLPQGAAIATGSLRRRSQLLNYRNDLNIIDLRGNVPTRLKKFLASDWEGMILAYAGLSRLGFQAYVREVVSEDIILPAVGQGVIAVECRQSDSEIGQLVKPIHNETVYQQVLAERALLQSLEGGCQVPIGVYTKVADGNITLKAMVGSPDGKKIARCEILGEKKEPEALGIRAAEKLLEAGAKEILEELRSSDS